MKILFTFLVLTFFFANAQAQEIEATLSGDTEVEGFSVKDSAGTTLFRVNGLGNVGIGTTTPTEKLEISGNSLVSLSVRSTNLGVQTVVRSSSILSGLASIGTISNHSLNIITNGLPVMRISNTGLVGIGTLSPGAKLDVAGTVKATSFTGDGSGLTGLPGAHFIGESYGGGIVFWVDATGQHGLIAAASDQSTGIQWYNGTYRVTNATGDGVGAGKMNTAIIIAMQTNDNTAGSFAALLCANLVITSGGVDYGDWHLPSKYELNLMYLQKATIGGFASDYYWSSTEVSNDNAWFQDFNDGFQSYYLKNYSNYVRAVRKF